MKNTRRSCLKHFSFISLFLKHNLLSFLGCLVLIAIVFVTPNSLLAVPAKSGQVLFNENCAGCHINGGNIIRRNRTLKLSDLKRRGLDNPEAIARIAKEGIGTMSGYEEYLGEDGAKLVAEWIWNQAQNAWTQG